MADAPRRRKLEKTSEPVVVSNHKYYCCRCGTAYSRQKGYFPVSHSPMYRGSGYLPICSNCIEELYEQYRSMLADDKEAMRRICMKLDLYWSEDIYAMVERTAGVHSRIRNYIGKTNIMKYIDKTFDDTLYEEAQAAENERKSDSFSFAERPEDTEDGFDDSVEVDQELIDFWGAGYAPDFYLELERRYKSWTEGISVVDPTERSLYRQICLLETIISRDAAHGKAIDKNVNALNSLLGSMNLKPAQKKSEADAELDNMPLGVGIQKWEYSRPLPPTPDNMKDESGIIRNVTTWFLGHACKMVGLRNSYCQMYEDAINEYRVKYPEYAEEDDDTFLTDIFGDSGKNESDGNG